MSDIEQETKPIFERLRKGTRDSISPVDGHQLAVWMTKTAMVYEKVAAGESPTYFSQAQRSQHRSDRSRALIVQGTLPRMQLFVARYAGESAAICMGQPLRVAAPASKVHYRGYVLTVVFFGVVLDAMFPPPEIVDLEGFGPGEEWATHIRQIWPATRNQAWPLDESFNDADPGIDRLPARWSTRAEDRARRSPVDDTRQRTLRELTSHPKGEARHGGRRKSNRGRTPEDHGRS